MFRMVARGVLLAFSITLINGCTTTDTTSISPHDFTLSIQDETPEASDLSPGDRIEVSVEVDGRMEVSLHRAELNHQGMVTLPLVGDVPVGGMKLAEARNIILKTYGAYYVNSPVVMISLMDKDEVGEWGYVTVLGRVARPGRIPIQSQKGMTLSEAIQAAGGFSSSAKQGDLRVSRIDEDGKKLQVSVDFKQIGQAGNAEADLKLIDGDIIYVPERIF